MTVAVLCAALGDPTRAALVERLAQGPASLSELAAPYEMTLTAVRKHVGNIFAKLALDPASDRRVSAVLAYLRRDADEPGRGGRV